MNFLFLDVETTGLKSDKHDIIQLAAIPIINGQRQETFNEFCQPINWDTIEDAALAIHGISREKLKTFQTSEKMITKFINYLKSFDCKFIIAGYNVGFDRKFISSTFDQHNVSKDFFSLFELQIHDVFSRVKIIHGKKIKTENRKLVTIAKHFDIEIDAHDALSDIEATIEINERIGQMLGEDTIFTTKKEIIKPDISVSSEFPAMAQLHLHSMYGMVESVPTIQEWQKWCEDTKTPGFSIVDHGSAISIYEMAKIKSDSVIGVPGIGLYFKVMDKLCPFNIWAINNTGYFNITKLSSLGHEQRETIDGVDCPVVSMGDIVKYSEGLRFGTGDCHGAIGDFLMADDEQKAISVFECYKSIFGDKLYVEFMPVSITNTYSAKTGFQLIKKNKLIPDGNLNKAYNIFLSKMIDKYNLPCIPVSGAHFIDQDDKLIQDIIAKNSYDSGKCYNEVYKAMTTDEIFNTLKVQLGDWLTKEKFLQWIDNTNKIINQAKDIEIKFDYHLPKIDIPAHIKQRTDDYNMQTYYLTVEKCVKHGRWNNSPEYIARFKKEIDVIMKNDTLNFLPYFLLYEDINKYARDNNILVGLGRGSAGGSLLSYYLKIIHIDPIQENLPFERFLSHARIRAGSFPDIDCDFSDRTPIIKYLEKKYGLGFAQIGTYLRMKTKNAIKDVMMALYGKNRNDKDVESICKVIPDSPQGVDELQWLYGYIDKEGQHTPGLIEQNEQLENFFMQFPEVERMVKRLIGLVRGLSRHPSAYVISTLDLETRIPTTQMYDSHSDSFIKVTQFEAPMVEKYGLVKADMLGVTTINSIKQCIALIKERTGKDYTQEDEFGVAEIYRLPEDDKVYKAFYNSKTDSSFQFNSPLIKGILKEFAPHSKHDLSALTALARPGALDAKIANKDISIDDGVSATQYYMDVRNRKRELSYIHPDLASVTTGGIFCIAENSNVTTNKGNIKIQNIQIGDQVLTHTGQYQNVSAIYNNGTKETVRVRLSHGEELICTPDHKVLTQFGWEEVQNLTSHHLVKSFWTTEQRSEIGDGKDWLIGLLLADGNMVYSTYEIACTTKQQAELVINLAKKEFNICGKVLFKTRCWYASLTQSSDKGNHRSDDGDYKINKLNQLCKQLGIHGLKCKEKILPNNYTLNTLAGFFDGNGSVLTRSIRLANKKLAFQLYQAFDSYRIPVSYHEEDDVYTISVRDIRKLPLKFKKVTCKNYAEHVPRDYIQSYKGKRRHLPDNMRQHFVKSKSQIPIAKDICEKIIGTDKLNDGRHLLWSNVLSIKPNGKQQVFDITVDNDHSFVVGGNTVHNCYQEDVMAFLVEIGGYTLEESDQIRNAIAKKKKAVMVGAFERVREATKKRGWTEEQANIVCNQVAAFAKYSFNRSHSRTYAELGYITMYLKTNHPLEWWCSVLNTQGNHEDKLRHFMTLLGTMVTSPSLKNPGHKFMIDGDKIVAPISMLKRVGEAAMLELSSKGPFTSLEDYIQRVEHRKVNIGVFSAIIKGRAADCFMDSTLPYGQARQQLMDEYVALRKSSKFKDELYHNIDPLQVFLMERATNKCFNKSILDSELKDLIFYNNDKFNVTSRRGIPATCGNTIVLSNSKVAEGLIENNYEKEVGMVLLFQESHYVSGISKRTGKKYSMVKVLMSDGYADIEGVFWDGKKPLNWPKDSLLFVTGIIKKGWATPVSITIDNIEKL